MGLPSHARILLIVVKNTSALDYSLPLLWKLKAERPQAEVTVLYCSLSRKRILRGSRSYSDMLSKGGIREYDFADFIAGPCKHIRGLCRWLGSRSERDSSSRGWLARVPVLRGIPYRLQRLRVGLGTYASKKVNVAGILPSLAPDVILFDNRSMNAFHGHHEFFEYCKRTQKKLVLLPHAPHHTGTTAFTPFDEKGDPLPQYAEYWMPFRFDSSWEARPDQKSQFAYAGYPGLDSEWLSSLVGEDNVSGKRSRPHVTSGRPLRCLFIIREFLPRGRSWREGVDAYAFDHDEFAYYLKLVGDAIRQSGADIDLVVKPHPSNDFGSVSRVFASSNIPRWRVTHESVYAELSHCDFAISLYSTTLLIPAMAGIPVILLHSRIQDEIHQWPEIKQMYTGLHFYLENPEDLRHRLKEVTDIAIERRRSGTAAWNGDVEHLRYFYPDGAAERCLERLDIH